MKVAWKILVGMLGWVALAASELAAGDWTELQSGLQPAQVAQVVGVPLMRQAARGFETWVYDDGGCAQFAEGRLTAWTAPRRQTVSASQVRVTKVSRNSSVSTKVRPESAAAEIRVAGQ